MSHSPSPVSRPFPWLLAALLLAGSSAPEDVAPPAPRAPVAWPSENPYPEASARRQARLAELLDPTNNEVASLSIRYLEDVTSNLYMGGWVGLADASSEFGDMDTAMALLALAVPKYEDWGETFQYVAFGAGNDLELDALLAFLHDLPPQAQGGAHPAVGSLVKPLASAGRLNELDSFALALAGNKELPLIFQSLAEAYERQGDLARAKRFALLASEGFRGLFKEEPAYILNTWGLGVAHARMLFRLGLEEEGAKTIGLARELLVAHLDEPDSLAFLGGGKGALREAFGILFELYALAGLEAEGREILSLATNCESTLPSAQCKVANQFDAAVLTNDFHLALVRGRGARGDLPGARDLLDQLTGWRRDHGEVAMSVAELRQGEPAASMGRERVFDLAREYVARVESGTELPEWGPGPSKRGIVDALVAGGFHEVALQVVRIWAEAGIGDGLPGDILSDLLETGRREEAFAVVATLDGALLEGALGAVTRDMRHSPTRWGLEEMTTAGFLAARLPLGWRRTGATLDLAIALARTGRVAEAREYLQVLREEGIDPHSNTDSSRNYTLLLALVGEEEEAASLMLERVPVVPEHPRTPPNEFWRLAAGFMRFGLVPDAEAKERLVAITTATQPRCGSWQRMHERVEALLLCDLGQERGSVFQVTQALFVGADHLVLSSLEGPVVLLDISGPPAVVRSFPPLPAPTSLAVHPATGRIAVGNTDGLFAIGDLATGKWLTIETLDLQVQDLLFAATGLLLVAHQGGLASIVPAGQLELELTMGGLSSENEGTTVIAVSPDGNTVYAAKSGGWLHAVDLQQRPPRRQRRMLRGEFWEVAALPLGDMLLTTGGDQAFTLWDSNAMTALRTFETGDQAYLFAVSPVEQVFATHANKELQLWRLDATEPYFTSPLSIWGASSRGISFSPDGQTIFAPGYGGSANFLTPGGEIIADSLIGHGLPPRLANWSPDSRSVATSSMTGVIVWRLLPAPLENTPPLARNLTR